MKKIILLIFVMLVFGVVGVSADSFVNESQTMPFETSSTGWTDANWNDDDWDTYSSNLTSSPVNIYANFTYNLTLPDGYGIINASYEFKDNVNGTVSVYIHSDCLDASKITGKVVIKIVGNHNSEGVSYSHSCLKLDAASSKSLYSTGYVVGVNPFWDYKLYDFNVTLHYEVNDSSAPVVNVTSPFNESYSVNVIDFNVSLVDDVGVNFSWFNFSTSIGEFNQTPVEFVQNMTLNFSQNGGYCLFVCANDSSDNIACENRSFIIDIPAAEDYTPAGGGGGSIEPEFESVIGECDQQLDMLGTAIKIWFVRMTPSRFLDNTFEVFKRLWAWIMCLAPASIVDVRGLT